jgi:hypothetical protein
MTAAHPVLRRLDELGAKIWVENGRLKLRATSQVVPKAIVAEVRAISAEIIALLDPSGKADAEIASGRVAAYASEFDAHAAEPAAAPWSPGEVNQPYRPPSQSHSDNVDEPVDDQNEERNGGDAFDDDLEERAAIAAHDGGIPSAYVEAFARLQRYCPSNLPSGDRHRWQMAIEDAAVFLERWGHSAAELDWPVSKLFGLSGTAPMARYDEMGLFWLLRGRQVTEVTKDWITLGPTNLRYYRDPPSGRGSAS